MANKRYAIRVDSAANVLTDFKAALVDYYGAYNDPANLSGVRFDYDTSPYVIFRCSAIADAYIRLRWQSNNPMFSCGDGVNGNDVTNPIVFGGTQALGSTSVANMVLGPHTLLWHNLQGSLTSRIVLVGQLTNADYAVMACAGINTASYTVSHFGYNTTDGVYLWPVTLSSPFGSAAGKLYTQPLILRQGAAGLSGLELTGVGAVATFQDVLNVSHAPGNATPTWGATFVLTTSGMYMNIGEHLPVLPTGLLMEHPAV